MNWTEPQDDGTCDCCNKEPATEPPEPCPFKLEIHGNDSPCNCCQDCRAQCRQDI